MSELKKKKKKRKWTSSAYTIISLFVVLAFLLNGTWKLYVKERDTSANLTEASVQMKDLLERESQLRDNTERLQTQAGIEEEIRNKFRVSKDGERTMIIVGEEGTTSSTNISTSTSVKFLSKIKAFFGRND